MRRKGNEGMAKMVVRREEKRKEKVKRKRKEKREENVREKVKVKKEMIARINRRKRRLNSITNEKKKKPTAR